MKTCPHCDKPPGNSECIKQYHSQVYGFYFSITCYNCGARGPRSLSYREAEIKWDERKRDTRVRERMEDMFDNIMGAKK